MNKNYNKKDFEKSSDENSLYNQIKVNVLDFITKHSLNNSKVAVMLVVCTQNSRSCTQDHFQHMIKTILLEDKYFEDIGFHLIDKADATSTSNSSPFSCTTKFFGDKPFNCRTRVYGNKNLLSPEYIKNNGKVIKNETYIKSIPIGSEYLKKSLEEKCGYVEKCEKRIINIKREGVGGILFDILLKYPSDKIFKRFIICNSNLSFLQSNIILIKLTETLMNSNLSYEYPEMIITSPFEFKRLEFMVTGDKFEAFEKIKKILQLETGVSIIKTLK